MAKLGRSYLLFIDAPDGGTLQIKLPFTIEFDVQRNILSAANTAKIRIYNLAKETRNQIYHDVFDYNVIRKIELRAGYGSVWPVIFRGRIGRAYSFRQGVDFITEIDAYDDGNAAFITAVTNKTYPEGTSRDQIIGDLLRSMPGVDFGGMGSYPGKLARGNSYSGSTADILQSLTGGGFFIDNGRAFAVNDDEVVPGSIQVISSASGLLGTPKREESLLSFDMLFEPRLVIGQQIELQSVTEENFTGLKKVVGLYHRGMISESVAGDAVTTVDLFYGLKSLTMVGT